MRIMGGSLRSRRIKALGRDDGVRPISGRIKKSLFDILRPRLGGARFLDLFAGTGAVGIEALSRGAESAFFVDANRKCVELIQKNLGQVGFAGNGRAHVGDGTQDMSWIAFRSGTSQFDIIFMSPPYRDMEKRPLRLTGPAVLRVAEAKLGAPGAWLIAQHQVKEPVDAPPGWEMFRREKYGDSFLSFFRQTAAE